MTADDVFMLKLTAWRENRGGGLQGMQSVMNVLLNRAARNKTSPYTEATRPMQFSSIAAPGNPELPIWPNVNDGDWQVTESLAASAEQNTLDDITEGATLYYAPGSIATTETLELPDGKVVPFPMSWNKAGIRFTVEIENQLFFREAA